MTSSWLRVGVVFLLVGGAYFAALRWLECAVPLGVTSEFGRRLVSWELARICTFGVSETFDRQGPGPLWPRLAIAALYVAAALWVLFSKRVRFG